MTEQKTKCVASCQTAFIRLSDTEIQEYGMFSERLIRELHLEHIVQFDVTVILKADFREDDRFVEDGGFGQVGEVLGWLYGDPKDIPLEAIAYAVYGRDTSYAEIV